MSSPLFPPAFRTELAATMRLAAPLVLANFLQMALLAVDVIFVARLGKEALAAASLAAALFGVIIWGLSGLGGAVAPLIAAEIGRNRHAVREVRRSVRMAIWLAVISGLGGMALCLLGERFMILTGQDPQTAADAGSFLRVLSLATIPLAVANVLRVFLATLGRPALATAITALAVLVNVIGNWAFIYGRLGMPELGLVGSATASAVTGVFTVLAYVFVIARDRRLRRFHIFGRLWRYDGERLGQIVRIGVPVAMTIVAEGGLFSSAAFLMGRIGVTELAAHAIALQIGGLAFQVPYGVGQAATIRVGYHFGAGDREGIARAGVAALGIGVAFTALSAAVMLLVPKLILSIYVDTDAPDEAAMVALAVTYLAICAAFQFFDAIQAIAAALLRGLQDTHVPMVIALCGYWLVGFVIAAGLGLATPLGGLGVWIGLATGLIVVSALLLWRWSRRARLRLLPAQHYPAGPMSQTG